MIDNKTIKKLLIIIILIIIVVLAFVQLRKTLARYETTTTTERDVDVAFWMIEEGYKMDRLFIKNIYPSDTETFEYTFTVSNYNANQIAETDLSYELALTMSTFIPLEYEIQKNGTTCNMTEQIITDSDGTCYKKLSSIISTDTNDTNDFQVDVNESDEFTLKVTFPLHTYVNGVQVENRADLEYPDLIQDVKIELSAMQIVEGE